jgi:hypothetical protein
MSLAPLTGLTPSRPNLTTHLSKNQNHRGWYRS